MSFGTVPSKLTIDLTNPLVRKFYDKPNYYIHAYCEREPYGEDKQILGEGGVITNVNFSNRDAHVISANLIVSAIFALPNHMDISPTQFFLEVFETYCKRARESDPDFNARIILNGEEFTEKFSIDDAEIIIDPPGLKAEELLMIPDYEFNFMQKELYDLKNEVAALKKDVAEWIDVIECVRDFINNEGIEVADVPLGNLTSDVDKLKNDIAAISMRLNSLDDRLAKNKFLED